MINSCNIPLSSPSKTEGTGGSMTTCIKRILCTTAIIITLATSAAHTQDKIPWTHGGPLLPDSSNFVTASLLVIDPGPQTVSAMGHSAIRLECPVHNLDYCFTLENNPEYGILAFILGMTPAHDIAVHTNEFLKEFVVEKRRVMQYELNLTLHEKQELWRAADIEFTNEGHRLFNYSYNGTDNCTSICLELIEQALIDEKIVVDKMPAILTKNNGTYFRHMSRRSPWVQFLLITLGGTACDETWNMRNRMAPEVIIPLFEYSHFEGQEGKRAILKGDSKELVSEGIQIAPNPVTPVWVFGGLLIIAIIISLLQYFHIGKKLVRLFDIGLFVFQLLLSALLIATSCYGSIVGTHWNWYLVPFNPLPLIIWLIWRKRKEFYKVYLLYTVVLVLFILATPLSEQLDLPHQLIIATLAVRCLFNYINGKKNADTNAKNIIKQIIV